MNWGIATIMGANLENTELMQAIEAHSELKVRGFTATCGPTGGVVVDRWNHVRGVWHFHDGHYFWIPAGYTQPTFRIEKPEEALEYTATVVSNA